MTPDSSARAPRSILIVRLGAVGDIVRTLPALGLIRRTWPEARIGWAVESGPAGLLRGTTIADELVVLERRALVDGLRRLNPRSFGVAASFLSRLRDFGADLAIDFQGSFKSGLTCWLSGARVRVGFDRPHDREGARFFVNVRAAIPPGRIHRVERAALLARAAGASDGPLVADLALSPDERAEGRAIVARLCGGRPAVALAPFTSLHQAWKRYPAAAWSDVARGLADAGAAVVVVCGPGEEAEAARLCAAAGANVAPSGVLPLRTLAGMIAACRLFVGGDTGPMHIAWAVGAPVLAVYGPTDPVLNAPYGAGHVVVAPAAPTRRNDSVTFPGITPPVILSHALPLFERPPDREKPP